MGTLIKFFGVFQIILKLWPYVIDAVRLVESLKRTESGHAKRLLAKQFVKEKVPNIVPGMSEEDWDNLLGGLIDVVVAVLNWRKLW